MLCNHWIQSALRQAVTLCTTQCNLLYDRWWCSWWCCATNSLNLHYDRQWCCPFFAAWLTVECTGNSPGNACPQSFQLTKPLWTDPGLKSKTDYEPISTWKNKKTTTQKHAENLSNLPPKSLQARKKPKLTAKDNRNSQTANCGKGQVDFFQRHKYHVECNGFCLLANTLPVMQSILVFRFNSMTHRAEVYISMSISLQFQV